MARYSNEEALRIGEEHALTLKEILNNEKHNLDLFNLEVARFRLEHGMSPLLINLYRMMGNLNACHTRLTSAVEEVECLWGSIISLYQKIRDEEKSD